MPYPSLETIAERLLGQLRGAQEDLCRPIVQQVTRGKPVAPAALRASLQVSQDELEQRLAKLPPDVEFDRAGNIVGPIETAYRQRLEALAATLGVASRLSFSLASRQQMRQRYQQGDVTIFTSMIEHEAFGLVPLEAMASGCPVVATGVGGSNEYCLDGVNCVRVPPGDPAALACAVQHLAQSQVLRLHLVEGGLGTASACTLDRQATGIERSLLAASGFPRA